MATYPSPYSFLAKRGGENVIFDRSFLTDVQDDASLADGDYILDDAGNNVVQVVVKQGLVSGSATAVASITEAAGLDAQVTLTSGSYSYHTVACKIPVSSVDFVSQEVLVQGVLRVESFGTGGSAFANCTFAVGPNDNFRSSGGGYVVTGGIWQPSNVRWVTYSGTSATFDSPIQTTLTPPATITVAALIQGGEVNRVWVRSGDTLFNGVPNTADADVYMRRFSETVAAGTTENASRYSSELYAGISLAPYGTSGVSKAQLQRLKVVASGYPRD